MKIAVLSDTHIPHKHERLTDRVLDSLSGVDYILHCGDVVTPEVLAELAFFAPTEAVAGNHDLERFGDTLPRRKVFEFCGFRIGMIHGDELDGIHINKTLQMDLLYPIVCEPFLEEPGLDCIVFGHGHNPFMEAVRMEFRPPGSGRKGIKKDVLLFNPGKAIRSRNIASMGYLYLEKDSLRAELKIFTYRRNPPEYCQD